MSDQKTKLAGGTVPEFNPNIWDSVCSQFCQRKSNWCECDAEKGYYKSNFGGGWRLCDVHLREAIALHQAAVTTSALEPTLHRLESRIDKLETMLKSLIDLLD
ncbi:MAG: hypothetical protein KGL39_40745, partial [Patescibacteria group bacterium]|nr:hypothetical protein [Patescibacteria group bacterium]